MSIANCPKCNKVFTKYADPLCSECMKEEENIFSGVKKYLQDNPGSSLGQVAIETGVSTKKIMRYLKEGRLIITNTEGIELTCISCGKRIFTGRYCDACVIKVNQEVGDLFSSAKKPTAVMHTRVEHKK